MPDGRRQRLVAALREINGDSATLDVLDLPDTYAVVTGQQVGFYGGPAYSIYKALTAARLAQRLTQSGLRSVPVFWLATEDHDFEEVRTAWLFDVNSQPRALRGEAKVAPGQPVGTAEISSSPVEDLRRVLSGFLHADEVISLVEDCYQPGRTYGDAFRLFLQRVLAGAGLVFLDPLHPEIRRIGAPLLQEALARGPELRSAILDRNKELTASGYHAQVHFEPDTSLFFQLTNGQRLQLKYNSDQYLRGKEKVSLEEMAERPEYLSPNALLRPVWQDYLLPTIAYVGGPAEIAYLAQSSVLYKSLLGRAPVAVPRAAFTLLDERAAKQMRRFGLALPDALHGLEPLRACIASRLIPPDLGGAFKSANANIQAELDRLETELSGFDVTLAAALRKSRAKIAYQLKKNSAKAERESLRRDERAQAAAAELSGLLFPEHHLQERLYSILPFLARHGFDLIDTLYESVHSGCPDHQVLTL